jgi:hypothetical protein
MVPACGPTRALAGLRSRARTLRNGRFQVLLDDVLARGAEMDNLTAIGGGHELSTDELRVLRATRPGTNPWQREQPEPSP